MIIRPATLADVPWLLEAGARAQAEAPNYRDYPVNAGEQYKRLVRLVQRPDLVCIRVVGDETGFVCGALEPTVWFEAMVAVQNLLWVAPEVRGTARAWRLVAAFEQWARAMGATRAMNGTSSGINPELTGRFYEKMGYDPMGMCYVKELL